MKKDVKPLDSMKVYRACVNCRGRKNRCDLDPNSGRLVSLVISYDTSSFSSFALWDLLGLVFSHWALRV